MKKKLHPYTVLYQAHVGSFLVLILLLIAQPVFGGPVLIRAGKLEGQGWAFYSAGECRILTAAHLVDYKMPAQILVVGPEGSAFSAVVNTSDSAKDLALLSLVDPNSKEKSRVVTKTDICRSAQRSKLFDVMHLARNGESGIAWIERITSPAGGYEQLMITKPLAENDGKILVNLSGSDSISKGDSGAMVKFFLDTFGKQMSKKAVKSSIKRRLQRWLPGKSWMVRGEYLGVVISMTDKGIQVVPAEVIRDFIIESVLPTNAVPKDIQVSNENIEITRVQRGPFLRVGRYRQRGQLVTLVDYNSIAIELDLGSGDNIIEGVQVVYDESLYENEDNIKNWPNPVIRLSLGMERPNEKPDYIDTECDSPLTYHVTRAKQSGFSDRIKKKGDQYVIQCPMVGGRIARAAIVTMGGNPDTIDSVELLVR